MESKELLKINLATCHGMVMSLVEGMRDQPLAFPTSKGGCHPMWVVGNCTLGDAVFLYDWILGDKNPLSEWESIFGIGTEAPANAADYPSIDEVIDKAKEVHGEILKTLDSLSEADLDQPSNAPVEYAQWFGTKRQVFLMSGLHWMMHRGHLSDARRSAGKERAGA